MVLDKLSVPSDLYEVMSGLIVTLEPWPANPEPFFNGGGWLVHPLGIVVKINYALPETRFWGGLQSAPTSFRPDVY